MYEEAERLIDFAYPQVLHDSRITDRIFLCIEMNAQALSRYEALCSAEGKRKVNQYLGRRIKVKYHLRNTGRAPASSALIKSFALH